METSPVFVCRTVILLFAKKTKLHIAKFEQIAVMQGFGFTRLNFDAVDDHTRLTVEIADRELIVVIGDHRMRA